MVHGCIVCTYFLFRYFEGRAGYRLPKSHVGLEMELEVVGMAMAHSLLTDGPFHIPALHPGIYQFLLSHSRGLDQYYPQMEDIPITAQTIDLISLIEDVSSYYKGIT